MGVARPDALPPRFGAPRGVGGSFFPSKWVQQGRQWFVFRHTVVGTGSIAGVVGVPPKRRVHPSEWRGLGGAGRLCAPILVVPFLVGRVLVVGQIALHFHFSLPL